MTQPNSKEAAATVQMIHVPAPGPSSGGISTSTLVVLLILSSILSTALGPLIQNGLYSMIGIRFGTSPHATDTLYHQRQQGFPSQAPPLYNPLQQTQQSVSQQQPQQQQQQNIPLAKRVHTTSESGYQCKHGYHSYIINRDPLIIYIENFLQPGEAEHMIAVASPKMQRSLVSSDRTYSKERTSSSAYLEKSSDHVISCIEERASLFSNISIESTEPLQVVWYTEGQEFRPHHDYIPRKDLKKDYWSLWGQRYTTFFVYLNEPEHGGFTVFPDLGLDFKPKANDAIFWFNVNLDEKEDVRTLHGGAPVKGGEKYAINIWQRKMLPDLASFIRKEPAPETDP